MKKWKNALWTALIVLAAALAALGGWGAFSLFGVTRPGPGIFLLLLLAAAAYGAVLWRREGITETYWKKLGCFVLKELGTLAILMVMGIPALLGALSLLISGKLALFYVLGAGYLIVCLLLLYKFWGGRFSKRGKQVLAVVLCLAAGTGAVYCGNDYYQSRLPRVGDMQGADLIKYEPFSEGSAAARLDGPSTLRLSGSLPRLDCATALYPVMAAFVQAAYPEGDYPVFGGKRGAEYVFYSNTVGAYEALIDGQRDVIFVAGPSDGQLAMAKDAGVELECTPIGREAFVFFVHSKNPVENLTVEQVRGIYSGKLTNWGQAGGRDQSIRAFQRPENSGSQTALQRLMGDVPLMEPISENVAGGMGDIIHQTAAYRNHKNAVGYSFRFFCTEMVQEKQIKLLALDGVYPDRDSIRDGSYPITSNFYAVTVKGRETPDTRRLIEWILSPQGQELIEKTGYVGV